MGRRPLSPQGVRPVSKCQICELARTKQCRRARLRHRVKTCKKFVPLCDEQVT